LDDLLSKASFADSFAACSAGFVSPMVMGFLISAFNGSYNAAFWFLVLSAVISIVACMTLGNARKSLQSKVAGAEEVS
jgi:nitrate/nitrite transporter NarK